MWLKCKEIRVVKSGCDFSGAELYSCLALRRENLEKFAETFAFMLLSHSEAGIITGPARGIWALTGPCVNEIADREIGRVRSCDEGNCFGPFPKRFPYQQVIALLRGSLPAKQLPPNVRANLSSEILFLG